MIMSSKSLGQIFNEIERCLPEGGDWCDLHKAHTLAALVLSTHPKVVVEIGVWMGGSLVPMLIALREVGGGKAVAIDPWNAGVSVRGESEKNATWWGGVDHDKAFDRFGARLIKHGLTQFCEIQRTPSDDASVPPSIDILHVDGSHTEQAVRDVDRFCPAVKVGGFAILDDVQWAGGAVVRAVAHAELLGFESIYPLGTGVVMQRRRGGE